MTDDIEREALALLNEWTSDPLRSAKDATDIYPLSWPAILAAVTKLHAERAAHEATKAAFVTFRQDVSDDMEHADRLCDILNVGMDAMGLRALIARFIIPKPNPHYESVRAALPGSMPDHHAKAITKNLERELAARGLQITEIDNG